MPVYHEKVKLRPSAATLPRRGLVQSEVSELKGGRAARRFLRGVRDDNARMELLTVNHADPIPAFTGQVPGDLRQAIGRVVDA